MRNIVKAIETEKMYLQQKINGEKVNPLIDQIREYGFESLEDYFSEKTEYNFNQLEFGYEECKPATCLQQVFSTINDKEIKFLYMVSDYTFVFSCTADVNEEYCNKNNIPIYNTSTRGGTIVSTTGDVSFCICVPESIGVDERFILKRIASVISQNKYPNYAKVDGNDILIKKKKVLGSASYRINGMFALVAHVSFNDNSDLISKICIRSKNIKEPSYIKNITQEEFRMGVSEWLRSS